MIRTNFLTKICASVAVSVLSLGGFNAAEAEEAPLTPEVHTLKVAEALPQALRKAEHQPSPEEGGTTGKSTAAHAHAHGGVEGKHASGKGIESDLIIAPAAFSMVAAKVPPGATLEVRRAAPLSQNKAEETDGVEIWGDEQYAFSPWYELEVEADKFPGPDSDEPAGDRNVTDLVWVEPGTAVQLRVDGGKPEDIELTFMDTERENASIGEQIMAKAGRALAFNPTPIRKDNAEVLSKPGAPKVITRDKWKADESVVRAAPSYASKVDRAVVHHTSGSNSYSESQSAAMVRGILHYHAVTRGWSDIGYNFLVDKYGNIYEGRAGGVGRGVIGAHAQGFNSGTVGISTMGTYNAAAPSSATQNAVTTIIAWKSKLHGFDPTGRSTVTSLGSNRYPSGTTVTLNRVIGHRDVGYTDCPGNSFYPLMSRLASRAKSKAASMTGITPVDPKPPFDISTGDGGGSGGGSTSKPTPKPSPTSKPNRPINLGVFNRVSSNASRPAAAVEISKYTFKAREAKIAVIAREDGFADAMAGGPLAGKNGPLLLTNTHHLSSETRSELKRVLGSGATIYVLGGTKAVSDGVLNELRAFGHVKRLRGSGRVETSVAIANEVLSRSGASQIMIAREGPDNRSPWADALSGGAWGAAHGVPVVLSNSGSLSAPVAGLIKQRHIKKVHILGGTGALGAGVVRGIPKGTSAVRHSGKDRTETATAVAEQLWGKNVRSLVLANGYDGDAWVWALAAAPLAARTNSPLLLSGSDEASQALNRWASNHAVRNAVALGNKNLLTDQLLSDLNSEFRR